MTEDEIRLVTKDYTDKRILSLWKRTRTAQDRETLQEFEELLMVIIKESFQNGLRFKEIGRNKNERDR